MKKIKYNKQPAIYLHDDDITEKMYHPLYKNIFYSLSKDKLFSENTYIVISELNNKIFEIINWI